MDEFTKLKLEEWGFEEFVERFKEEEIDSVAFLTLTEPQLVAKLFPKLGQQSKFLYLLRQFKEKHNNEKDTTNTLETMTMMMKMTTITTAKNNYTDDALKLQSTRKSAKSLANLISSSKDIHDTRVHTNVVKNQVPQPQVTTTTTPFFNFHAPSTSYKVKENNYDDDDDDDYIPTDISLSNTIPTQMCEIEKSGYWNLFYCIFATEKIVFETVAAPDIRLLSDAATAAVADTDLHNTPYLRNLLLIYKYNSIKKNLRLSKFFSNRISQANNFQDPLVSAETIGMLNLYRKMQRLGLKHNGKFKFSVSDIGMDLGWYTRNGNLALDPVHSVSNNVMDILRYPLRYGLIPKVYWLDLKMFLKTVIFKKVCCFEWTIPAEFDAFNNMAFHINFIEGDIEAIVFDYWSRSTVDLIKYDERVPRKNLKGLLHCLFRKLCVPSKVVPQHKINIFLTNFMKFAEFDLNEDIIPKNCLLFLKTKISTVWPEISVSDQNLWGVFFNELKVHHLLMAHTILAIFNAIDRRFEFIKSKAAQVRLVRGKPFYDVSLWSENSDHSLSSVIGPVYVTHCILPAFFKSSSDVDRRLCIAIDNLYYYHIFLLSRYAILHNIDVTTKILTSAAVHGFLSDQRDPSMHKYRQKSYVLSISMSVFWRSEMVTCFRRLYIRDSDKFEAEFEITEFDESLYQSLNELIIDRMNYALSTVIDRKGQFSPKRYAKLHPRPAFDREKSPSPNRLCCYAFASSLYAYMYGLTRKESISMQCVELNCNFERSDKDFYDNIIAESKNVIGNPSSQKKKKSGYRFDSDTDSGSDDEIEDSS